MMGDDPNSVRPWRQIHRRKSRQVMVGNVAVGGDAPISVQSMTNTLTTDVAGTLAQINAIADAGADELVVHARTKAHGYRPPAYWDRIADVRAAVSIPIVANGEIWSVADARRCREASGCDDLMLGRGIVTDPGLALAILADQGRPVEGLHEPGWAELQPLLAVFWQLILAEIEPRARAGRMKQWLNYLRRRHPEAEHAFAQIRTLTDSRQVDAIVRSWTEACQSTETMSDDCPSTQATASPPAR